VAMFSDIKHDNLCILYVLYHADNLIIFLLLICLFDKSFQNHIRMSTQLSSVA